MPASLPAEPADEDRSLTGTVLRARRELAAAIRRGDYRPNQRLIESELTAALDISRATLRSVLIALEQENYISLELNRSARVRQFSLEEAHGILETREILESAAAGLAAARILPEECDRLDELMASMADADRDGDAETYSRLNHEFHTLVITAARQPTLLRLLSATPYPLVVKQFHDFAVPHPRPDTMAEHRAIVAALRINDGEVAEAAMRHHIAAVRQGLALPDRAEGEGG
ncbi:GntR family transcriptional regulator [Amycolatopsis acidicola]|uniref:GntR family transcriptional regulator n=1 Tax=Amycolatopsis acidicola TaxID=2596893 RepID=A0A5N0V4N0_9PSEU|nr:GntR family transcriptional regulator [Amycolatopsis acidicola]KAA9160080.1 GntR family transcriptional regulator [Amycolatopsis acidicola]